MGRHMVRRMFIGFRAMSARRLLRIFKLMVHSQREPTQRHTIGALLFRWMLATNTQILLSSWTPLLRVLDCLPIHRLPSEQWSGSKPNISRRQHSHGSTPPYPPAKDGTTTTIPPTSPPQLQLVAIPRSDQCFHPASHITVVMAAFLLQAKEYREVISARELSRLLVVEDLERVNPAYLGSGGRRDRVVGMFRAWSRQIKA